MTDKQPSYEDLKENAEQREKENAFFNFYAADYMASGEGRTIWIMIDRNYDKEQSLQDMKEFVGVYFEDSIEEYTEEDFLKWYKYLLPDSVKNMIEKKNVPVMCFKQEFHFNYA
jgi:hypothetical protein